MALTATATNGLEFKYNKAGHPANPVVFEGSSGVTYTKGRLAALTSGLLVTQTSTHVGAQIRPFVGVIAETVTTTATDREVKVYDNPLNVYTVSFDGQKDGTVAGSTSDTTIKLTGVSATTANRLAGNLIHVYTGPGKGTTKTVVSNTAANPTIITVSGNWTQRPTTASSAILLSKHASTAATAYGANVGRCVKLSTAAGKVSCADATLGGANQFAVVGADPANLTLDVMIRPTKSYIGHGTAT
jgi:hypothetical protein